MKLSTAILEFIVACEADGLSASTVTWYKSILKSYFAYQKDCELASVGTASIRNYVIMVRRKYSEHTASDHLRVQFRFWKWCSIEYGIENPMKNIKYPKVPKTHEPRSIAHDDILRLFDACGDSHEGIRNRAILAFLLDTGARASGVCSLTIGNLDMARMQAVVTEKGRKTRTVVFSTTTAMLLSQWLDKRARVEPVFYNVRELTPLTGSGLLQIVKRLKKKSGVTGRAFPHAFRHAFARDYLLNGGELATVSRLMGHSDIEITASYYAIYTESETARLHNKFSPMDSLDKKSGEG